ncbi:hypothetical protein FRC11_012010 [Ceratobasidium sp. 423]|nr:hypothetical protein FRC11_012010 [Ceratobasidium sp. 423]
MASLEWLFHSAGAGDYRYLHFSGHGYAYEVEKGHGKAARVRFISPTAAEHYEHPVPTTSYGHLSSSPPGDQIKFYREALLTEWESPSWFEEVNSASPIKLDAHNRIDDEEFNTMVAKLPKGCILTMTLDCSHGGRMHDITRKFWGSGYRGSTGSPIIEPGLEDNWYINRSNINPNTSPGNLFVPPAFYLHSKFSFDPKVTMERVQGPDPFEDVAATVFSWSGYSTSRGQAGVFTSAFTSAMQDVRKDISHLEMLQDIRRDNVLQTHGTSS